jgi:putative chitinase
MSTLRIGSKGPEVERLQRLLNVKPADGDFGPKTAAAVKQFQQSHGLVADGVVGQRTWDALEKGSTPATPTPEPPKPPAGGSGGGGNDGPTPQAASSVTLAQLRAIYTQAPVKKLEGYLPHLNSAMTEAQINNKLRKSAFLAQVAHESAEFVFMKEQGGRSYFMRMYDISGDRPAKARELGNLSVGDGAKYTGGPFRSPARATTARAARRSGSISSITPSSSRPPASPSALRLGIGRAAASMKPPTNPISSASRG